MDNKNLIAIQRLVMCYWIKANSKDDKIKELYEEVHSELRLDALELRKKLNMTEWD